MATDPNRVYGWADGLRLAAPIPAKAKHLWRCRKIPAEHPEFACNLPVDHGGRCGGDANDAWVEEDEIDGPEKD